MLPSGRPWCLEAGQGQLPFLTLLDLSAVAGGRKTAVGWPLECIPPQVLCPPPHSWSTGHWRVVHGPSVERCAGLPSPPRAHTESKDVRHVGVGCCVDGPVAMISCCPREIHRVLSAHQSWHSPHRPSLTVVVMQCRSICFAMLGGTRWYCRIMLSHSAIHRRSLTNSARWVHLGVGTECFDCCFLAGTQWWCCVSS